MPAQKKPGTPPLQLSSILRLGGYLVACVHTGLDDGQLTSFRRQIVDEVGRRETCGVVIDLTAVDVLDSFACVTVRQITQMVGLRGADTVVVGLAPDVAFAMVELGVDLGATRMAADVDEGLHVLQVRLR
jgi:rsbT antagonist protein RsbS